MDTTYLRQLYYTWHDLEQRLGTDMEIIDHCLLSEKRQDLGLGREELLRAFTDARDAINPSTEEERLIKAKLHASTYLLRALMGERIEFGEYLKNTTGVEPQTIPEEYLEGLREEAVERFGRLGYEYTEEGQDRFLKDNRITAAEAVLHFDAAVERTLPGYLSWLGLEAQVQYRKVEASKDAYWAAWVSTDRDGKTILQMNTHPSVCWRLPVITFTAMHEVLGHMAQHASIAQQVLQRNIDPVLGIATTVGREAYGLEGIAETLSSLMPASPLTAVEKAEQLRVHICLLMASNAHVWLNEGMPRDEVKRYWLHYRPDAAMHERNGKMDRRFDERINHPFLRAYSYLYGRSIFDHLAFARQATEEQRRAYLRRAYTGVLDQQATRECWTALLGRDPLNGTRQ